MRPAALAATEYEVIHQLHFNVQEQLNALTREIDSVLEVLSCNQALF